MAAQTTTAASPRASSQPIGVWLLPVLAAWIVPGGGHFLQKKIGRGALLLASIGLMFLFGMFMRGMMFSPEKGDILTTLINYGGFICDMAAGVFYFAATMFGYAAPDMPGYVHDYGTKFLVTAGLLNILAMVDAYEIAVGKKD
ncbi:MAG: hypothetical protein M3N93_14620 [Acidobacteriota bacterium]|nr:hypothetical protein [Acidobacteriota bacterium]